MKPVHAARNISDKNYWALEEFLDLLIQTLDIVEDSGMLPIVLHQNNLRLMYEKWQHYEQTSVRQIRSGSASSILDQPAEIRRIWTRYQVIATLASRAASRVGGHRDYSQKTKETQANPPASQQRLPQKASVNAESAACQPPTH
jgi:hypothetical protein